MKLRTTPLDYIHQELFATFDERPRRCDGLISVFANASYHLDGAWRRGAIRWAADMKAFIERNLRLVGQQ